MELLLNNQKVKAQAGETLLQVAQKHHVKIPTLCQHKALEARGSCRLCMVEVQGAHGHKRLVASCVYPAQEGLRVTTESPQIEQIRKTVLGLLLARCPETEVLQALAREYGVVPTGFQTREKDDHCMLCGLCVRVCEDVIGAYAIGISGRGTEKFVGPAAAQQGQPCIGCGACVHVCPTRCIEMTDQGMTRRIERWKVELSLVACKKCGTPVTTRAHLEFISKRMGTGLESLEICPACSRTYYAQKIATEGHM